jgi:hypothetical protein
MAIERVVQWALYLDEQVNFSNVIWVAKGTWLVVRHSRLDLGAETLGDRGGVSLEVRIEHVGAWVGCGKRLLG